MAVQPTRGLDVGAIEYIHGQLVAERDAGKAVLLVSLELDEVMSLSDRILVMYEGEIVGELDPKKTTVQELGLYMAGAKRNGGKEDEGMRERLDSFWAKDGTKTVLASLASIVIGLLVGCIVIVVVGLTSDSLSRQERLGGRAHGPRQHLLHGPRRGRRADLRLQPREHGQHALPRHARSS